MGLLFYLVVGNESVLARRVAACSHVVALIVWHVCGVVGRVNGVRLSVGGVFWVPLRTP